MIDINELKKGMPGITPQFGGMLAEACGVCLESEGHTHGAKLKVFNIILDRDNLYPLLWPSVTDQGARCYNDDEEATEYGAVGIAILLAKIEIGFTVVERSRKGTGFDYWLGDETEMLFQNKARLEISGIRHGNDRIVSKRMAEKIKQTDKSDGYYPAYIIIVEFSCPLAEVRKK